METLFTRALENLIGRLHGPLTFRLILQPLVAVTLAFRAGLRDARAGRPPYGWALATAPDGRRELLREAWRDVAKVFVAAIVVDTVYEIIALHHVYPGESLIVAAILALLPYLLIRGPAARIAYRWTRHESHAAEGKHHPV